MHTSISKLDYPNSQLSKCFCLVPWLVWIIEGALYLPFCRQGEKAVGCLERLLKKHKCLLELSLVPEREGKGLWHPTCLCWGKMPSTGHRVLLFSPLLIPLPCSSCHFPRVLFLSSIHTQSLLLVCLPNLICFLSLGLKTLNPSEPCHTISISHRRPLHKNNSMLRCLHTPSLACACVFVHVYVYPLAFQCCCQHQCIPYLAANQHHLCLSLSLSLCLSPFLFISLCLFLSVSLSVSFSLSLSLSLSLALSFCLSLSPSPWSIPAKAWNSNIKLTAVDASQPKPSVRRNSRIQVATHQLVHTVLTSKSNSLRTTFRSTALELTVWLVSGIEACIRRQWKIVKAVSGTLLP